MLLLLPSLPLPLLQFAVGLLTVFVNAFVFCSCLPARSLMSHLSIFAWNITENRTHSLPLSPLSLSLSRCPPQCDEGRSERRRDWAWYLTKVSNSSAFCCVESAASLCLWSWFFSFIDSACLCHERTRSGNVGKAIKMKQRQMQRDCTERKKCCWKCI